MKEVHNLNKKVKGEEEVYNKLQAELAEKNKISKDARELETINAVTLGWNSIVSNSRASLEILFFSASSAWSLLYTSSSPFTCLFKL
ncbi:hypothetical protein SLEP1_g29651 [Rubroshorea leprosula]|uniref:Uncharacterized protein n=1 Tax=Rubroshorea leprosula TaxID=152421 RepID=A0AAV5K5X5_9ROSI|nr:hypothetical protein SLEP1_g29651 [Rubroshorea leprosula]